MLDNARTGWHANAGDTLVRLVGADGSAAQPQRQRLLGLGASQRDLCDAIHALCAVHGQHPGIAATALAQRAHPDACDWIERIADGCTIERGYLAQLAAAAGPLPSTPGQAETHATLVGQRHAMDMLARSDRRGCSTGAVAALVLDWHAIRALLDHAAARFGIDPVALALPSVEECVMVVDDLAQLPAVERAMSFGAAQVLAQHRGLWQLLDARASAREAA
ncbi:hypothetical protein GGQ80_001395 [Sphingomonas jinjuensis]|uniref:Uncharacterized protein n=1 Tax=Sphingomonas jinjuensis TaxID=535907 RepID=A0A840F2A8_9SPHN|nr:hypothetical protein [Sphingomonas jinjuensis]MBB4153493.1 hypothetical protein [Sphingomonas jinjuensis]